jgi:Tol biopolymer transport system component
VYTRSASGDLGFTADIWRFPLDPGGTAVPILETPAVERNPALSPDGRWLAYVSNVEGWWDVYIRPFPGPGGGVKISADGGINPVWARSGNELFFTALNRLWIAGSWTSALIRPGSPPQVESRAERFPRRAEYVAGANIRHWTLSPDGQRALVMSFGTASAEGRYVVVENFGEELKRLVPIP